VAVASLRFYLDTDMNPFGGNEAQVKQATVLSTGTNNVYYSTLNLALDPATALPRNYALSARISDATHARYLYAPQGLALGPSRQPPILTAAGMAGNQFQLSIHGWPGQTVVIEASTNLEQ
jgi:hypothetical protein